MMRKKMTKQEEELEGKISQAYIVIGDIAGNLGIMDNPAIQQALDYFSEEGYKEDFLPWYLERKIQETEQEKIKDLEEQVMSLLGIITDIREASRLGVKPMLGELAPAVRIIFDQNDEMRHLLKSVTGKGPFICGVAGEDQDTGTPEVVFVCPEYGADFKTTMGYHRQDKYKEVMNENRDLTKANLFFRDKEAAFYEIFDVPLRKKAGTFRFDGFVARAKQIKEDGTRYKAALEQVEAAVQDAKTYEHCEGFQEAMDKITEIAKQALKE